MELMIPPFLMILEKRAEKSVPYLPYLLWKKMFISNKWKWNQVFL